MPRFVITLVASACLCACGYQANVDAKPKRHESESRRSAVASARQVKATQRPPVRIKGHPISDKLSPHIERTSNRFQNALLYKPNDKTITEEQRQFATLLVQEAPGRGRNIPENLRIGAVMTDGSGQSVVDTQRPTVYTAESHVMLGSVYCQQRVHLWAYPAADPNGVAWRGVRVTYGPNKFPLIWEQLTPDGQPAVLYLCTTIDKAAEKEYGKPLPGRQSTAEQALDEQPDVVVARILPPGAQPTGPMVYLDAAGKSITTLLCRCMPAQADNFVDGPYYDLMPLEILGDVQISTDGPFRLIKSTTPSVDPGGPSWLERVLRLPKQF